MLFVPQSLAAVRLDESGSSAECGSFYFKANPDGGTVSFDSVPMSFIAILQAVTFDTWTDPMFDVMDAYNYQARAPTPPSHPPSLPPTHHPSLPPTLPPTHLR